MLLQLRKTKDSLVFLSFSVKILPGCLKNELLLEKY
jgi:hypothetical protein